MACRICKRGNCTESFHSFEEQERFEEEGMTVHGQNCECCAAHAPAFDEDDDTDRLSTERKAGE